MDEVIVTKNLVKHYGEIKAVDGIDLSVSRGEIFGLLGPNGAGKTTTIGMLTTIVRPTSGSALVDGHSVSGEPAKVRKSIGIVFQEFSVDSILTGRENLDMSAQLYGVPKALRKSRINEVLELVGLRDRADSQVKTYSGGMKRRLELARGLLHKPSVLFLDEPTLGLDPQSRKKIWEYIKDMATKQHMTILLTTHYMEEAELMCDRIAVIDHGKIIAQGTPDGLIEEIGGDIVYLVSKNLRMEEIKSLPYVKKVEVKENIASITLENASKNLPDLLKRAGDVDCVEVRKPTLNDVFLKITGRAIREGDDAGGSWYEDALRYTNQGGGE